MVHMRRLMRDTEDTVTFTMEYHMSQLFPTDKTSDLLGFIFSFCFLILGCFFGCFLESHLLSCSYLWFLPSMSNFTCIVNDWPVAICIPDTRRDRSRDLRSDCSSEALVCDEPAYAWIDSSEGDSSLLEVEWLHLRLQRGWDHKTRPNSEPTSNRVTGNQSITLVVNTFKLLSVPYKSYFNHFEKI